MKFRHVLRYKEIPWTLIAFAYDLEASLSRYIVALWT